MNKEIENKTEFKEKTEPSFKKEQLIRSKLYKDKRDLLNTILDDYKVYKVKEVNKLIDDFMKRKVI